MLSTNRLVGSLVYRTREALNANRVFMDNLEEYTYSGDCLYNGKFHLWHYPGTPPEISECVLEIGSKPQGARYKFPAVLNFLPVDQITRAGSPGVKTISLNLAICASTQSDWLTEQREPQTFDLVLRPVYEELLRQICKCRYFVQGYGNPPHKALELFTRGSKEGVLVKFWGEHIDAIEIHGLQLTLNPRLCEKDLQQMEEENGLLSEI